MPHILLNKLPISVSPTEWSHWLSKHWQNGSLIQKQTTAGGYLILTYFTGLFEDMWCTELRKGRVTTELRNFSTLESALEWHGELVGRETQGSLPF